MDTDTLQHIPRYKSEPSVLHIDPITSQFTQNSFFEVQYPQQSRGCAQIQQSSNRRFDFYIKSIQKGDLESLNEHFEYNHQDYEEQFDEEMDLFYQFFNDDSHIITWGNDTTDTYDSLHNYCYQDDNTYLQDGVATCLNSYTSQFNEQNCQLEQAVINSAVSDYLWLDNDQESSTQPIEVQIKYSQQVLGDMYITEYQMITDKCLNTKDSDALDKLKQAQAQNPYVFNKIMQIDQNFDKRLHKIYKEYKIEQESPGLGDIQMFNYIETNICKELFNNLPSIAQATDHINIYSDQFQPSIEADYYRFIKTLCNQYLSTALGRWRLKALERAQIRGNAIYTQQSNLYAQMSVSAQKHQFHLQNCILLYKQRIIAKRALTKEIELQLIGKESDMQRENQSYQTMCQNKEEEINKLQQQMAKLTDMINQEIKIEKNNNTRISQLASSFSQTNQDKLQALRDEINKRNERLESAKQETQILQNQLQDAKQRQIQVENDTTEEAIKFAVHLKKAEDIEFTIMDTSKLQDILSSISQPLISTKQTVKKLKQVTIQRNEAKAKIARLKAELEMLVSQREREQTM